MTAASVGSLTFVRFTGTISLGDRRRPRGRRVTVVDEAEERAGFASASASASGAFDAAGAGVGSGSARFAGAILAAVGFLGGGRKERTPLPDGAWARRLKRLSSSSASCRAGRQAYQVTR